jgi:protein SCO1/2
VKFKTMLNVGVAATFVVVATTVVLTAFRGQAGAGFGKRLPVLGEVPDFALTEASGAALRGDDLAGKVWIASFIFTRCAEACPAMMREEARLQSELPARDDLRLVSFSVDPDYDTPEVLRRYAEVFGADRARWLFLTGDKKLIYGLAIDGFRLAATDADPATEMPILHSSKLVLVDRRGAIRGYYDSTDAVARARLVRDTERVLAERS